ncbi:MAG: flagellin lysine-N-methylase [Lachnospiraceae bacterium]|nr:flagellin lysine-N-methylase [Lachnospiraceae bacterium]
MFKIIKLEIFDSFKCLMDKCPDNCCNEDWTISVDNETYGLYMQAGMPNLDSFISKEEPHVLIKKNGKCPFITPEGLCLIHKELGEEFLGNTCKSYPRFVSTYKNFYNDLIIENIGLSCPAASDWLLGLDRVVRLEEKVYYEQKNELGRKAKELPAEKNMKNIISFLQKRDSFIDGMRGCYEALGMKYTPIEFEVLGTKDLLLRNIAICFLFENLMLESQKEAPNYASVLDKICRILLIFDRVLSEEIRKGIECNNDLLSDCLYRIMRNEDH